MTFNVGLVNIHFLQCAKAQRVYFIYLFLVCFVFLFLERTLTIKKARREALDTALYITVPFRGELKHLWVHIIQYTGCEI